MNINDINRKNVLSFNTREMETLSDEFLESKISDMTVKQFIAVLRLVKNNIRVARKQKLINAEQQIYTHIKNNPGIVIRNLCIHFGVGYALTKYYTDKMLDEGKVVAISTKPGSRIKGYYTKEADPYGAINVGKY